MKVRTILAGAAIASAGLLGTMAPLGHAATCGTGPTRTTDANGNPDGKDAVGPQLPDGGQVYQNGSAGSSGNVGLAGPNGYIEAGGNSSTTPPSGGIQGSAAPQGGASVLNGRIDGSGVCVNGTQAP